MTDVTLDLARSLALRLGLTRPLAFLDLETTGISPETDRIVEVAVVLLHPDGTSARWERLVHPGRAIPAEATAVHRISDADVAGAPPFRELAAELAALLADCDIAGFNVARFDLKLLSTELARAGVACSFQDRRVVDAMAIFHRHERRDLAAAVRFYVGRDHDGHRAGVDVDATIAVLHGQLERYGELPRGVAELAAYCDGRQPDWLTSCGKLAWRDGAARITFGKHAGKSLQTLSTEEPGYLRWILDKDFGDDFKQLVSAAMTGRFPERSETRVA